VAMSIFVEFDMGVIPVAAAADAVCRCPCGGRAATCCGPSPPMSSPCSKIVAG